MTCQQAALRGQIMNTWDSEIQACLGKLCHYHFQIMAQVTDNIQIIYALKKNWMHI